MTMWCWSMNYPTSSFLPVQVQRQPRITIWLAVHRAEINGRLLAYLLVPICYYSALRLRRRRRYSVNMAQANMNRIADNDR